MPDMIECFIELCMHLFLVNFNFVCYFLPEHLDSSLAGDSNVIGVRINPRDVLCRNFVLQGEHLLLQLLAWIIRLDCLQAVEGHFSIVGELSRLDWESTSAWHFHHLIHFLRGLFAFKLAIGPQGVSDRCSEEGAKETVIDGVSKDLVQFLCFNLKFLSDAGKCLFRQQILVH